MINMSIVIITVKFALVIRPYTLQLSENTYTGHQCSLTVTELSHSRYGFWESLQWIQGGRLRGMTTVKSIASPLPLLLQ